MTTLQKELDKGVQAELDKQLRVLAGLLDQHPAVTVTWFRPDGKKEGGDYLIATGAVRKIDAYREVMILEGGEQILSVICCRCRESVFPIMNERWREEQNNLG